MTAREELPEGVAGVVIAVSAATAIPGAIAALTATKTVAVGPAIRLIKLTLRGKSGTCMDL